MMPRLLRLLPTAYLYALDMIAGAAVVLTYVGFAEQRDVPMWFGYPLAMLVGTPLAGRRKKPLLTLAIVATAQVVATLTHITLEPFFPTAFAMYSVASLCSRRVAAWALVATLVCAPASVLVSEPWPDGPGLGSFVVVLVGAAWALGRTTRVSREYEARQAVAEAERAVTEERMRIARELHDVVAHSLSLIAVKAGIAAHVGAARPEVGQEALRVIEAASRDTLVEMRRLLGVLRSEDAAVELAPMPGMGDLPALVSRASAAGVRVDLSVRGEVPDALGLTVYRVVQESVTNVVKHAAPASCSVEVEVAEKAVVISVVDDGPGERVPAGATAGHGLVGMRERVAVYGGTFSAGPRAGRGFAVRAEVPLS
ncbi:sensor histidine kinase [Saccharothrix syringae]|uniref:histidine kinase n=2 Tax=Saccharothrix syringae TaxID=103733 RepID=A0A5Q0H6E5_SACSY|nr:sensor histidine kinase [Saccharothrix syringae]